MTAALSEIIHKAGTEVWNMENRVLSLEAEVRQKDRMIRDLRDFIVRLTGPEEPDEVKAIIETKALPEGQGA